MTWILPVSLVYASRVLEMFVFVVLIGEYLSTVFALISLSTYKNRYIAHTIYPHIQ